MKPKFALNSTVDFGDGYGVWTVAKYHRLNGEWEVMFCSNESGVHRSVPCVHLERFA